MRRDDKFQITLPLQGRKGPRAIFREVDQAGREPLTGKESLKCGTAVKVLT